MKEVDEFGKTSKVRRDPGFKGEYQAEQFRFRNKTYGFLIMMDKCNASTLANRGL